MKPSNYDIIRSHLEYGHKEVEVQTKGGPIILLALDLSLFVTQRGSKYSIQELEDMGILSITPIPHRYKKLEVGTKVDVIEPYDKSTSYRLRKNPHIIIRYEMESSLSEWVAIIKPVDGSDSEVGVPLWAITPHVEGEARVTPSQRIKQKFDKGGVNWRPLLMECLDELHDRISRIEGKRS